MKKLLLALVAIDLGISISNHFKLKQVMTDLTELTAKVEQGAGQIKPLGLLH